MKRRGFLQSVTAASVLLSGKASAFSNIANSLAEQAPTERDSAASASHGRFFIGLRMLGLLMFSPSTKTENSGCSFRQHGVTFLIAPKESRCIGLAPGI